jgi:hypothetical protein
MSTQHSNPLQQTDTQFDEAVNFGAEHDRVNVGNLVKWTVITVIFVLSLIFTGFELYNYSMYTTAESQAINTTYEVLTTYRKSVDDRLSTYGVVDDSKKMYHVPIEKAMQLTIDAYSK